MTRSISGEMSAQEFFECVPEIAVMVIFPNLLKWKFVHPNCFFSSAFPLSLLFFCSLFLHHFLFLFFFVLRDISNAALVCKHWHALITDSFLWKNVDLSAQIIHG